MIRFFHSGYTPDELRILKDMIHEFNKSMMCTEKDCDDCDRRVVCNDLLQFERRLQYLCIKSQQENWY